MAQRVNQQAIDALKEVVEEIKPNLIFFWGHRLWNNFPKDNYGSLINGNDKIHFLKFSYNLPIIVMPHPSSSKFNYSLLLYIFIPLILGILYGRFSKNKKKEIIKENKNEKQTILGSFIFYPEQNKLMQKAKEIALSKKECELLEIFVANANLVVKREELTKKVWEDNGVIVGRSLDTYISKLRKKLQEDESIKLINIHGVGYKLEVK